MMPSIAQWLPLVSYYGRAREPSRAHMQVPTPMTQQGAAHADNEMSSAAPADRVFDPMLPRMGHYPPIRGTEDRTFSAWLQGPFDEILSLSDAPPRCPPCQGGQTVLTAHPKPAIPVFRCLDCEVHFRRTTGTPPSSRVDLAQSNVGESAGR